MQQSIVKTYEGSQAQATAEFKRDAAEMAKQGYVAANQAWAPGSYGCGAFIVALLLCFILIGFLVFLYMLIVKPAGTLTVTYVIAAPAAGPEKTCPQCAERVKAAAKVCRFCGFSFPEDSISRQMVLPSVAPSSRPSGAHEMGRKLGRLFAKK